MANARHRNKIPGFNIIQSYFYKSRVVTAIRKFSISFVSEKQTAATEILLALNIGKHNYSAYLCDKVTAFNKKMYSDTATA